jgi:hypothetical protein
MELAVCRPRGRRAFSDFARRGFACSGGATQREQLLARTR